MTPDLDAIRRRAEALNGKLLTGSTGTPPWVDGVTVDELLGDAERVAHDQLALLDHVDALTRVVDLTRTMVREAKPTELAYWLSRVEGALAVLDAARWSGVSAGSLDSDGD